MAIKYYLTTLTSMDQSPVAISSIHFWSFSVLSASLCEFFSSFELQSALFSCLQVIFLFVSRPSFQLLSDNSPATKCEKDSSSVLRFPVSWLLHLPFPVSWLLLVVFLSPDFFPPVFMSLRTVFLSPGFFMAVYLSCFLLTVFISPGSFPIFWLLFVRFSV